MGAQGPTGAHAAPRQKTPKTAVPEHAKRLFEEGEKHLRQRELDAARDSVQEGLKIAPQSAEGYNLLGLIYTQQKKSRDARKKQAQQPHLHPAEEIFRVACGIPARASS